MRWSLLLPRIIGLSVLPPLISFTSYRYSNSILCQTPPQQLLERDQMLKARWDSFNGVIIDGNSLPKGHNNFSTTLTESLKYWKEIGVRGVWLQIPIELSEYIPIAVTAGFVFHHAEPNYVMLTSWLADTESTIPANASHQIGIGAVALNKNNELLVVQEKNGPLRGLGVWKIPTGLVNCGEDIVHAAIREVKEETSIDAEFVSVIGFKESHGFLFGKSDLLFIIKLNPLSTKIEKQLTEIEDCQWMPVDQFLQQPIYNKSPVYKRINDLIAKVVEESQQNKKITVLPGEFQGEKFDFGFRPQENWLFYGK